MRKLVLLAISLTTILWNSCDLKQELEKDSIVIDFSSAQNFEQSKLFEGIEPILFNTDKVNEIDFLGPFPKILFDKTNIWIGDINSSKRVYRFDDKGEFLNSVGRIGTGPGEYDGFADFVVDAENETIEILTQNNELNIYNYSGNFIKKETFEAPPVFSFCKDQLRNYWLYFGGNNQEGNVMKYGATKELFLPVNSKLLPFTEHNFTNSSIGSLFRESFNSNIYKIEDGTLKKFYHFDFEQYDLPSSIFDEDPLKLAKELSKLNFAIIKSVYENDCYLYAFVIVNKVGAKPSLFHCFVRKSDLNQKIIKMSTDLPQDNYRLNVVGITFDSNVLFWGGIGDTEDSNNVYLVKKSIDLIFKE